MNAQHITKLARAAKRDGLTLSWSLIRLAERLERAESLSTLQTTDAAERSAPNERLDDEALALVLMAVIAAYPTGGDLPAESIPQIN
jgi:hypothetical protein